MCTGPLIHTNCANVRSLVLILHSTYVRCNHLKKLGEWILSLSLYYLCNFLWIYSYFIIKSLKNMINFITEEITTVEFFVPRGQQWRTFPQIPQHGAFPRDQLLPCWGHEQGHLLVDFSPYPFRTESSISFFQIYLRRFKFIFRIRRLSTHPPVKQIKDLSEA